MSHNLPKMSKQLPTVSEELAAMNDELPVEGRITNKAGRGDKPRYIRPVERQRMRPWLISHLDNNDIPGLVWQNRHDKVFKISWKHAANQCFNMQKDTNLFERWAIHTGRHQDSDHKRWKANFRCALNSLPDVVEHKEQGIKKGNNAFKVYRFLDEKETKMNKEIKSRRKKEPPDFEGEEEGGIADHSYAESELGDEDLLLDIPRLEQLYHSTGLRVKGTDLREKLRSLQGHMDDPNLQDILAAATASLAAGSSGVNLEKISIEHLSRLGEMSKMKLELSEDMTATDASQLNAFFCSWCEKVFPSKIEIFKHFLIVHQNKLVARKSYKRLIGPPPDPGDPKYQKLQQEIEDLEKEVFNFTTDTFQAAADDVESEEVVTVTSESSAENQALDLSVKTKGNQTIKQEVALDLSMSGSKKSKSKFIPGKFGTKRRRSSLEIDYTVKFGNYGLSGTPRTKRQMSLHKHKKEQEEEKLAKKMATVDSTENAETSSQRSVEDLVHAEILMSLQTSAADDAENSGDGSSKEGSTAGSKGKKDSSKGKKVKGGPKKRLQNIDKVIDEVAKGGAEMEEKISPESDKDKKSDTRLKFKAYRCGLCMKKFDDPRVLGIHVEEHKKAEKASPIVKLKPDLKAEVKDVVYYRQITPGNVQTVWKCQIASSSGACNVYVCGICKSKFYSLPEVAEHEKMHSQHFSDSTVSTGSSVSGTDTDKPVITIESVTETEEDISGDTKQTIVEVNSMENVLQHIKSYVADGKDDTKNPTHDSVNYTEMMEQSGSEIIIQSGTESKTGNTVISDDGMVNKELDGGNAESTEQEHSVVKGEGKETLIEPQSVEVVYNEQHATQIVLNEPQTSEMVLIEPQTTEIVHNEPQTVEIAIDEQKTTETVTNESQVTDIEPQTTEVVMTEPQTTETVFNDPQYTVTMQNELQTTVTVPNEPMITESVELEAQTVETIQNEQQTIYITQNGTQITEMAEYVHLEPNTVETLQNNESQTVINFHNEPQAVETVQKESSEQFQLSVVHIGDLDRKDDVDGESCKEEVKIVMRSADTDAEEAESHEQEIVIEQDMETDETDSAIRDNQNTGNDVNKTNNTESGNIKEDSDKVGDKSKVLQCNVPAFLEVSTSAEGYGLKGERKGLSISDKKVAVLQTVRCGICSMRILKQDIKTHLESHDSKDDIQLFEDCIICRKMITRSKMNEHLKAHSVLELSLAEKIKFHRQTQLKKKIEVPKKFEYKSPIDMFKMFVCNLCNLGFEDCNALAEHVEQHLKPDDKQKVSNIKEERDKGFKRKPAVFVLPDSNKNVKRIKIEDEKESDDKAEENHTVTPAIKQIPVIKTIPLIKQIPVIETDPKKNSLLAAALSSGPKYKVGMPPKTYVVTKGGATLSGTAGASTVVPESKQISISNLQSFMNEQQESSVGDPPATTSTVAADLSASTVEVDAGVKAGVIPTSASAPTSVLASESTSAYVSTSVFAPSSTLALESSLGSTSDLAPTSASGSTSAPGSISALASTSVLTSTSALGSVSASGQSVVTSSVSAAPGTLSSSSGAQAFSVLSSTGALSSLDLSSISSETTAAALRDTLCLKFPLVLLKPGSETGSITGKTDTKDNASVLKQNAVSVPVVLVRQENQELKLLPMSSVLKMPPASKTAVSANTVVTLPLSSLVTSTTTITAGGGGSSIGTAQTAGVSVVGGGSSVGRAQVAGSESLGVRSVLTGAIDIVEGSENIGVQSVLTGATNVTGAEKLRATPVVTGPMNVVGVNTLGAAGATNIVRAPSLGAVQGVAGATNVRTASLGSLPHITGATNVLRAQSLGATSLISGLSTTAQGLGAFPGLSGMCTAASSLVVAAALNAAATTNNGTAKVIRAPTESLNIAGAIAKPPILYAPIPSGLKTTTSSTPSTAGGGSIPVPINLYANNATLQAAGIKSLDPTQSKQMVIQQIMPTQTAARDTQKKKTESQNIIAKLLDSKKKMLRQTSQTNTVNVIPAANGSVVQVGGSTNIQNTVAEAANIAGIKAPSHILAPGPILPESAAASLLGIRSQASMPTLGTIKPGDLGSAMQLNTQAPAILVYKKSDKVSICNASEYMLTTKQQSNVNQVLATSSSAESIMASSVTSKLGRPPIHGNRAVFIQQPITMTTAVQVTTPTLTTTAPIKLLMPSQLSQQGAFVNFGNVAKPAVAIPIGNNVGSTLGQRQTNIVSFPGTAPTTSVAMTTQSGNIQLQPNLVNMMFQQLMSVKGQTTLSPLLIPPGTTTTSASASSTVTTPKPTFNLVFAPQQPALPITTATTSIPASPKSLATTQSPIATTSTTTVTGPQQSLILMCKFCNQSLDSLNAMGSHVCHKTVLTSPSVLPISTLPFQIPIQSSRPVETQAKLANSSCTEYQEYFENSKDTQQVFSNDKSFVRHLSTHQGSVTNSIKSKLKSVLKDKASSSETESVKMSVEEDEDMSEKGDNTILASSVQIVGDFEIQNHQQFECVKPVNQENANEPENSIKLLKSDEKVAETKDTCIEPNSVSIENDGENNDNISALSHDNRLDTPTGSPVSVSDIRSRVLHCRECKLGPFKSKYLLKQHTVIKHLYPRNRPSTSYFQHMVENLRRTKRMECGMCDKKFESQPNLLRHQISHRMRKSQTAKKNLVNENQSNIEVIEMANEANVEMIGVVSQSSTEVIDTSVIDSGVISSGVMDTVEINTSDTTDGMLTAGDKCTDSTVKRTLSPTLTSERSLGTIDHSDVKLGEDNQNCVKLGENSQSGVSLGEDNQSSVKLGEDNQSGVKLGEDSQSGVKLSDDNQIGVKVGEDNQCVNVYHCRLCQRYCKDMTSIKDHLIENHKELLIKCDKCMMYFMSEQDLHGHSCSELHQDQRIEKCENASEQSENTSEKC